MRKVLNAVLLFPLLGTIGCAAAAITTPPVMVAPTNPAGAMGLDIYAGARAAGQAVPVFKGQETVEIRTFSGGKEVTGPVCLIDSGVYRARFSTPANVVVPDYGANSPAIFVRCEAQGLFGSTTVNAYNHTSRQRYAPALGTGVVGAIVIGAISAASRNEQLDDYKYPDIDVRLRPSN